MFVEAHYKQVRIHEIRSRPYILGDNCPQPRQACTDHKGNRNAAQDNNTINKNYQGNKLNLIYNISRLVVRCFKLNGWAVMGDFKIRDMQVGENTSTDMRDACLCSQYTNFCSKYIYRLYTHIFTCL